MPRTPEKQDSEGRSASDRDSRPAGPTAQAEHDVQQGFRSDAGQKHPSSDELPGEERGERPGAQAGRRAAESKEHIADETERLADATAAAADAYRNAGGAGIAAYARELSDNMSRFSSRLRERSVDDLAQDARRIARENPTAFLLASVAIGFGLSRFFKASRPDPEVSPARIPEPQRETPPTTGGIV